MTLTSLSGDVGQGPCLPGFRKSTLSAASSVDRLGALGILLDLDLKLASPFT